MNFKSFSPSLQLVQLVAAMRAQAADVAARTAVDALRAGVERAAQVHACARCSHALWTIAPTIPLQAGMVHCRLYVPGDAWPRDRDGAWCSGELIDADGGGDTGVQRGGARADGMGDSERPARRQGERQ